MKNKKKYLAIMAIGLLAIFALIRIIGYIREQKVFSHTSTYKDIVRLKNNEIIENSLDDMDIYDHIDILLSDKSVWDKIALSNHFNEKFHNPNDIIRNIGKYESIDIGSSYEYLNKKNSMHYVY